MKHREVHLRDRSKVRVREEDLPKVGLKLESEAFDLLVESVRRQSLLSPIFVDVKGYVTSGHYRLWAADRVGLETVPCVVASTQEEIIEYLTR